MAVAAACASTSGRAAAGALRPALLLLLLALLQQLPVPVHQGEEVVKLSIVKSEQTLQHSTTQHGTSTSDSMLHIHQRQVSSADK
jgi:hypothetical protein